MGSNGCSHLYLLMLRKYQVFSSVQMFLQSPYAALKLLNVRQSDSDRSVCQCQELAVLIKCRIKRVWGQVAAVNPLKLAAPQRVWLSGTHQYARRGPHTLFTRHSQEKYSKCKNDNMRLELEKDSPSVIPVQTVNRRDCVRVKSLCDLTQRLNVIFLQHAQGGSTHTSTPTYRKTAHLPIGLYVYIFGRSLPCRTEKLLT